MPANTCLLVTQCHGHASAFIQAIDSTAHVALLTIVLLCSARLCLPWKLAQILEGTRAKGNAEQTSMASALADMFPADLTPLIDMSGKVWAHTVSTLALSIADCGLNTAWVSCPVFMQLLCAAVAKSLCMLRMTDDKCVLNC